MRPLALPAIFAPAAIRPVSFGGGAPPPPPAGGDGTPPPPPAGGGGAPPPPAPHVPFYKADTFPADWRDQIATGLGLDDGKKAILGRYQTFDKFGEAFFHAQDKIRAGEAKLPPTLPENPTPEQVAEYRTKIGLPVVIDDYKIAAPDGVTTTEQDARILDSVRKYGFEKNLPPAQINELMGITFQAREAEIAAAVAQHGLDKQTATRQLKETWGSDYETNNNLVSNLLAGLPESAQKGVLDAQLADGRMLLNSPEVMVWLADLARQANPAATVLPNSNNPVAGIDAEIKQLESKMGTPEWYKDAAAQTRYQQLVTARDQIALRK